MRSSLVAPVLIVALGLFACGGSTFPPAGGDAGADATANDAASDTGAADAGPDTGGGACDGGACGIGLDCCGVACRNLQNDPQNCGKCGRVCSGATSMCNNGNCEVPTCSPKCTDLQVCCLVQKGGPIGGPECYTGNTCPVGCPACN